MAAMAVSKLPNALITITTLSGRLSRMRRHSSSPFIPGMLMSTRTMSTLPAATISRASCAAVELRTAKPSRPSPSTTKLHRAGSSSTTSRFVVIGFHCPLGKRQIDGKTTSFVDLAGNADPAPVVTYYAVGHGQPQAGSFTHILGGEERLEGVGHLLG